MDVLHCSKRPLFKWVSCSRVPTLKSKLCSKAITKKAIKSTWEAKASIFFVQYLRTTRQRNIHLNWLGIYPNALYAFNLHNLLQQHMTAICTEVHTILLQMSHFPQFCEIQQKINLHNSPSLKCAMSFNVQAMSWKIKSAYTFKVTFAGYLK